MQAQKSLLLTSLPWEELSLFHDLRSLKNIRDFNRSNKNTMVRCTGHQNKEYASNMAFLERLD